MSSDLDQPKPEEEESLKKTAEQILATEIHEGISAIEFSAARLFVSGLSAGLDLGFSVLVMGITWTLADQRLPVPIVSILMANSYAIGFIFVVIGRSELFTEQTTLAVLPVFDRQASVASLLRVWAIIFISNVIGAAAFAGLVAMIAPRLGVANADAFGHIAHRMTDHPGSVIFCSAVLAGWLMGLLSWLVAAVRDTISQIVIVWLITAVIGYAGLHHVVLGSVEVLAGLFLKQNVTLGDFGHFLLWTTLGNIAGGVFFVGLIKYGHAKTPEDQRPDHHGFSHSSHPQRKLSP
jgi:formate/nitrite transporter FocA (FNT family)